MNDIKEHSPDALEQLTFTLLEAGAMVERRLDRSLSGVRGISFSEYRLLRELSHAHDSALTRVELAQAVGLTPSAVTRALKPLEKLGYIITIKSERDARKSLARLTPGGIELLADAQGVVRDVIASLPLETLKGAGLEAFLQRISSRRSA